MPSKNVNIPEKLQVKSGDKTWLYVILYIVVGLAIIGCFAGVIIPELTGKKATGQSLGVLAFWIGIATAIRGKQKGKSALLWFFIGFLGIGIIVVGVLLFILGFLKA